MYSKRSDADIVIESRRQERGCGEIRDSISLIDDNFPQFEYKSCLCHPSFQYSGFFELYEAYKKYQQGIMPFSGGYFEQPSLVLEKIGLIERLENLRVQEEQAKQPKK